jgi:hypothetical protein
MSLCYELGRKGKGSQVNAIIASMLRLGIRDFSKSFKTADASVLWKSFSVSFAHSGFALIAL